jgi:hypothetical protein
VTSTPLGSYERPHAASLPGARVRGLLLILALVAIAAVLVDRLPVSRQARSVPAALAEDAQPTAPSGAHAPTAAAPAIDVPQTREPVLVASETWDEASRRSVNEALSLLPPDVLSRLGDPALGPLLISISRDGRSMSGARPYGGPANFYTTNEGRNEVVLYPGQKRQTVLHELGHAYNLRRVPAGRYALVFLDEEMRSFLEAAGWSVLTPPEELTRMRDQSEVSLRHDGPPVWARLSRDDALEDFANSFALYFAAPVELQALSAERYAWFEARFGATASR